MSLCFFFFFKQKTAYEMRISDWSSDVCSSDLRTDRYGRPPGTRGWRVASLMEHIPWAQLYRPDLAFNQDGSFMACFEVRGHDLESPSPADPAGTAQRFAAASLHLGDRWPLTLAVHTHPVPGTPAHPLPPHT